MKIVLITIFALSLAVVILDKSEAQLEKQGLRVQFYEPRYADDSFDLSTIEIGRSASTELEVIRTARRLSR